MALSPYLAVEKQPYTAIGAYAGAATDKARVQLLIDLLAPDSTGTYRGMLGEMPQPTRMQLLVELDELFAQVV